MSDLSDVDAAVAATLQGLAPQPAQPDPAAAARFGVQQAAGTNADLHAELQRISAQTGVPISATVANPQEVKRQATLGSIDFDGLAATAPATAQLLGDIEKAKISHDDVANLQAIEQSFNAAQVQGRAVRGKVDELFQRPGDLRTSFGRVGEQFIRRGQLAPDEGSFVGGLVGAEQFRSMSAGMSVQAADVLGLDPTQAIRNYEIARSRAQAAGPDIQSVTGRALYGGLQSTVSNLPGLAASVLTMNPIPALAWAGLQSEGEAYGKYRARGATPLQAAAGALGEGTTEIATELIPMGFLAHKLGRAGLGEFITGFLAREMPTEQVATFVQDAIDTAVANPTKTWEQFWRERPQAAYETALSTLAQAGAIAGGGAALRRTVMRGQADEYDAQQAQAHVQVLQNIAQLAAASKVRERDAATFEGFMQSATEDGPLEKLYINPKEAQAAGVDLTQLAAVAPTAAAQIEQALQTGQDVAIPTSELMTRLPGSELEQSLVEHLKTDPGGFSAAGAKVYMQTQGETARAEVEKALAEHQVDTAFKDSMQAVHANVLGQLQAANRFTDDVNNPYAALWANFFGVQAARLKVMPEDLFNRFAPRIVAQAPVGKGGLLDQGAVARDALAGKGDGKAVVAQPLEDGAGIRAKQLADVLIGPALGAERNRVLGSPTLGAVLSQMRRAVLDDPKVLDAVVGAIPVDVVNNLFGSEAAAKVALHDEAMLQDSPAFNAELPITGGLGDAAGARGLLVRQIAVQAAEAARVSLNARLEASKGGAAAGANEGDRLRQEGSPKAPRATFDPSTNTIALLKAADLTSFLHESGHFFLEVLDDLAAQPDAPQQIKDDFAAFLRWTGVEAPEAAEGDKSTNDERRAAAWRAMSLDEKRPHHEDFARGFEAYLFEGKAPSVEMRGMFQRFRAWLLNVYRDISALNINLNKEIRGVFDRMLATTEQIQMAEDVRGYEALFRNKPEGMTDDEWSVYQIQANEATQQAITELEARSLGDMKWLAGAKSRELKRLQNEAAARRKDVEAEVRAEVEAMPVYQAIAAIKEQRKSDPQDRQAVKDWQAARDAEQARLADVVKGELLATPEGAASKGIQRGQFLARNKRQMANEVERLVLQWEQRNPRPKVNIPAADLEAVAALHGFTSGDELSKAIEAAQPMKDVIEGATDQRMLERYGDLTDPQAMERAAEEAIHNDARLRFVATEANALRKAVGQPALLAKAIRQFAADIVARTRVRDLTPAVYTAAEKRAGRDADRAMRDGKTEDAAIQKRNQLINGHAAKLTLEAEAEAQKIVDYLRRLNRDSAFKGIDADYVDQIHALLERFDLRPASNVALDKRASLKAWLDEQAQQGIEPDIPPELVEQANRTHFKNLTMEQLRGLQDTVKQIEHLGRLKKKLLTAKDQRDYEAIRDSIVQSIHDNAGDRTVDNRTRPTVTDSAIRMFRGYVLEHRKFASLVREMDGFKDGGVLWEYMVRSMNEAGDKESTMRADATNRLLAIVRPMLEGGRRGGKGQFFPSVGTSFNREERLGIALNMGNAGNLQRLLDGEGWNLQQMKPIVDTLTEADWRFVQQVWDFMESFRPEIAAKERRVYGKEPAWVDPQPITIETADGKTITLRGGYYPIHYDSRRSLGAMQHDEAKEAQQQMRGAYTSAMTRRSFTKERAVQVKGRPLMYSTDALFNGVNEIIHDLSWHEWLIDANKLMRSQSIFNAVSSHYGAEVMKQMREAIKDIAAGEFPATHAYERVLGELRAGAVVAGLGLNIMNSIINVQGITQSMVRVGTKWTAVGMGKFVQNPMALSREVAAKSKLMANRATTLNREVNEIQSMVRDKSKARAAMDRALFMPLTITQQMVDLPTWWGAYQKALDSGQTEERAVGLADQSVLDAQSGGQVKDLAGIQRGGPGWKLLTTFYGFFNSTYNLTVEATKATDFRKPGQIIALATNYLLLWTIPALMGTLLKNALTGGDWDEDKLAKKMIGDQISYLMGMMVGVRDLAGAVQSATGTSEFNTGYGGPSGGRFFGEVYKLAQQAHQGEWDMAFQKALDNVVGILFKLPSGQINRTIEGAKAMNEGQTSNPVALVTGAPPKH